MEQTQLFYNILDLQEHIGLLVIQNAEITSFNSEGPSVKYIECVVEEMINKINSMLIIDINFTVNENNTLPNNLSFYQRIYTYFYSLASMVCKYNQYVIVRFPQIFKSKYETANIDFKVIIDNSTSQLIYNNTQRALNTIDIKDTKSESILSKITPELLLPQSVKLFSFNDICFAGSFDHFHIGHNILLQMSLLLSKDTINIGVTSDKMISHKGDPSILQYSKYRMDYIRRILDINGYQAETINIAQIYDPIDFAGISKTLQCLVLTSETIKGGVLVNQTRENNHLNKVELVALNVIDCGESNTMKISSSIIRKDILSRIDKEKMHYLYEQWIKVNEQVGVNKENVICWWNRIRDEYMKKWKTYHNLNHIYSMIKQYEENQVNDINFWYAIWFHDIVYIPMRKDNEMHSIKMFEDFYNENKNELNNKIHCTEVNEYIKETENHLLSKENNNKKIDMFLDFDMMIMATDNIEQYENEIRGEYSNISTEEYNKGRSDFLNKILSKPHIYRTDSYISQYEEKARHNINKLLKQLNSLEK